MKKLIAFVLFMLALGASTTLSADGGCGPFPHKKCCYAVGLP